MTTDQKAAAGAIKQRLAMLESEKTDLEKQLSKLNGDIDLSQAVKDYVSEKQNPETELTGKQL